MKTIKWRREREVLRDDIGTMIWLFLKRQSPTQILVIRFCSDIIQTILARAPIYRWDQQMVWWTYVNARAFDLNCLRWTKWMFEFFHETEYAMLTSKRLNIVDEVVSHCVYYALNANCARYSPLYWHWRFLVADSLILHFIPVSF